MKKYLSVLPAIIFSVFLIPSTIAVYAYSLSDTGQTASFTDTYGEDSDYLINPPSYTKLNSAGETVTSGEWDMVKDNLTGLIWEMKTDDGTIHDQNKQFNKSDTQAVTSELNSTKFGGFSDWRLPTIKELITIIDHDKLYPSAAVNTDYFPKLVAAPYWSSTNLAGGVNVGWAVNFNHGNPEFEYSKNVYRVMAVRGTSVGLSDQFVNNGDGTVVDTDTGLVWSYAPSSNGMTWDDAISYSENLSLSGFDDWRLPSQKELFSIVNYNIFAPVFDRNYFSVPLTSASYWTSTICGVEGDKKYAYRIDGYQGIGGCINTLFDSSSIYVRVVRGGINQLTPICTSWTYGDWGTCVNNQRSRSIVSSMPSNCIGGMPVLTQSCQPSPVVCSSWTYSDWGMCTEGRQARSIASATPTNCSGGNSVLSRECSSVPACTENNWTSSLSPSSCPAIGQQTKQWSKIGQCDGGVFHQTQETISCNYQISSCTDFIYSDWGDCSSSGVQSRLILNSSPSNCTGGSSVTSRSCNYVPACSSDIWSCGNWGACSAGNIQSRICIKTFDCPSVQTPSPATEQSCTTQQNVESQPQATNSIDTNVNTSNAANLKSVIEEETGLVSSVDRNLSKKLAGNILLQVENHGQAWYVNPTNLNKYYLPDGQAAYQALRIFGLGITNADLSKIPVGVESRFSDADSDNDGLADKLEEGLGTDPNNPDTDGDGVLDGDELLSRGSNPLGTGKISTDSNLVSKLSGKILLQVQSRGEAWYINPKDSKRYYLKDGNAAYQIMRFLSLGITNDNIRKISVGMLSN